MRLPDRKKVNGILKDGEKIKEWMFGGASKSYLIDEENSKKLYSYTLFKLPWTLDDRDLITWKL
ncbi:MAG: hypothetical protein GY705_19730 [Bacteroidetes bacterium]|nr:hypothetical protein [Bacteroidota bacterium]